MSSKSIFIFEFIAGGGFNQDDIPPSLFCEGFGMLRAIIEDFKLLNYEIITILDYRIQSLSQYLNADEVKTIESEEDIGEVFMDSVEKCDYCFIIAPEFSKILHDFTKLVIGEEKTVLSIDLNGIKLGTSKYETYKFFKKYKVKTPLTFLIPKIGGLLEKEFVYTKFHKLNRPIVIKLDDGVGAGSIFYFETEAQLDEFFKDLEEYVEMDCNYILQEFIEGDDFSVSLIGTSSKSIILGINTQLIKIENSFNSSEYRGGFTPAEDFQDIYENLTEILKKLDLSAFIGYYGLDFIRKKDGTIYLIEINPRLTTSYIGLRNVLEVNPAQLIIDSRFNRDIPSEVKCTHFSFFPKVELEYLGEKSLDEIYEVIIPKLIELIPELITPPITFEEDNNEGKYIFSCLLATKEKDAVASNNRIKSITKVLSDYDFKIFI